MGRGIEGGFGSDESRFVKRDERIVSRVGGESSEIRNIIIWTPELVKQSAEHFYAKINRHHLEGVRALEVRIKEAEIYKEKQEAIAKKLAEKEVEKSRSDKRKQSLVDQEKEMLRWTVEALMESGWEYAHETQEMGTMLLRLNRTSDEIFQQENQQIVPLIEPKRSKEDPFGRGIEPRGDNSNEDKPERENR